MQIRFFFVVFISTFFNIYSESLDGVDCDPFLREVRNMPYIRYDFGISELNTVIVTKKDSVCDVLIYDRNDQRTVKLNLITTPLLDWAFNDMINEIKDVKYHTSNDYLPYFYQIMYIDKGEMTLVTSSYRYVIGDEELSSKLDRIKTFLVGLWIDTLCKNKEDEYPGI